MDLETENRIAEILLKEAAELGRQAERDGVSVYLQRPKPRGRPNSRFLTATVLGVQQANRAVEVNEMWRVRQKELELNDRLKAKPKDNSGHNRSHVDISKPYRNTNRSHEKNVSASCSSSKRVAEGSYSREDEGLRDEEIEEFLQSRLKRGRGSIGSRMDETGPYLPMNSDPPGNLSTTSIGREHRVKLGPQRPSSLMSEESSNSDSELRKRRRNREKDHRGVSDKKHSRKHKSKEKARDKKRRRKEEERSKHSK